MLDKVAINHDDLLPRLLQHLRSEPSIRDEDLARAVAAANLAGTRLDQVLVELGIVTESSLVRILDVVFAVPDTASDELPGDPVDRDALPPSYLAAARVVPLDCSQGSLILAMCDPFDDFTARAVGLKVRRNVIRRRIARGRFEQIFAALYGEDWLSRSDFAQPDRQVSADGDLDVLRDAASDAPVVRFVQQMLREAVEHCASDIHLRPLQHRAEMSFRISGSLVPQSPPDIKTLTGVVSRLKILAGLDISERRLPQDGKIRTAVAGSQIDIRISTMPHVHGEGVVLRLLGGEAAASSLADLGFSPGIEVGLETLFSEGHGLVLVTGPTGSGKSTTLHVGLRRLIRPELNVVTIEDPIEYRLEGAVQIQVDEKIGLTFPRILRSLLRQDPDVILVGEIRDPETARIAVQAALTGHLVLATLHTNSAMAAVPRLIDMGVEPYLLSAVLRGVLAQRLVRRICEHCRGKGGDAYSEGASIGCHHCASTGHAGRVAIGELMLSDEEITSSLAAGHILPETLRDRLSSRGYRQMADDAQARVARGEIAPEDARAIVDV